MRMFIGYVAKKNFFSLALLGIPALIFTHLSVISIRASNIPIFSYFLTKFLLPLFPYFQGNFYLLAILPLFLVFYCPFITISGENIP